ncbi:trypsin-1-like [Palaemon carinicauda]|uniref:trypsin-1-like n=1 Tax=Palaemon carinicauda TaxID=392227 RepID=UPI0035B63123
MAVRTGFWILIFLVSLAKLSRQQQREEPFVFEEDFLSISLSSSSSDGREFEAPCNSWIWMPTEANVTFMSPRYPSNYGSKQCQWVFKAFRTSDYIQVNCQNFDVGRDLNEVCRGDTLHMWRTSKNYKSFCGDIKPSGVESNFNWMYVLFQPTLFSRHDHTGFKCTAVATDGTNRPLPVQPGTSATGAPPVQATLNCKCGRKGLAFGGRIVGGSRAGLHEFPWQAALVERDTLTQIVCGAVLISNRHVLTAAHCVSFPNSESDFLIVLGEHDTSLVSETSQTIYRTISSAVIHENFDFVTMDNDIALLRMSEVVNLELTNAIKPICLPHSTNQYEETVAIVSGWGLLKVGGSQPSVLQQVNVTTMTNAKCQESSNNRNITSNMLCAADAGKDSCQGDSGGPLAAADGDHYDLIGLVSFGILCANPLYPGVYVRVSRYINWINMNAQEGATCPK